MAESSDETVLPTLFAHTLRREWGVGILSGESEGRRSYLFADGAERTLARGFHEMMREVEQPDHEQQATYARLRAALTAREGVKSPLAGKTSGPAFPEQYARLRNEFAGGLLDPKWEALVRSPRDATIELAQEQLAVKGLDSLLSAHRFEEVWNRVHAIVNDAGVVPRAARVPVTGQAPPRALALAVRDLLHGSGADELRFDRYLAAYKEAFRQPASWEAATAFRAFFDPKRHICVALTVFRKQLKTLSSRGSIAGQPNGADYARLVGVARVVANKLGEQGEMPRDLFDVYDFVRITLAPAKKRSSKGRNATREAPQAGEADE